MAEHRLHGDIAFDGAEINEVFCQSSHLFSLFVSGENYTYIPYPVNELGVLYFNVKTAVQIKQLSTYILCIKQLITVILM